MGKTATIPQQKLPPPSSEAPAQFAACFQLHRLLIVCSDLRHFFTRTGYPTICSDQVSQQFQSLCRQPPTRPQCHSPENSNSKKNTLLNLPRRMVVIVGGIQESKKCHHRSSWVPTKRDALHHGQATPTKGARLWTDNLQINAVNIIIHDHDRQPPPPTPTPRKKPILQTD